MLDVGCGNGSQILCLARELGCRVTALDNHQPYLDELQRRAQAEGSAFVMGISEALRAWRTQLVPGGALGFTDLVWLQDEAPAARSAGDGPPRDRELPQARGLVRLRFLPDAQGGLIESSS